mmetsp:Transcript_260/g.480  ORF Transcript_260/g.480 Transcript_260/m.480 type:complete len:84 (+) Transcript_260:3025-3276(+)
MLPSTGVATLASSEFMVSRASVAVTFASEEFIASQPVKSQSTSEYMTQRGVESYVLRGRALLLQLCATIRFPNFKHESSSDAQ